MGNKPYSVKNSEFLNCYIGIYQSQVTDATVVVNRFDMGTVPDESLMDEQFGCFIEGSTLASDFQENTFTKSSGNVSDAVGIYSKNLGGATNIIRRNTFNNLNYANVAQGSNLNPVGGLYYECNFNYEGTEFDFAVVPDSMNYDKQGIREIQGITDPLDGSSVNGAGNIFYHNSGISQSDFYNIANDTMRYLYGNYSNREPLYFSTEIISKTSTQNHLCEQTYCIEFCKTDGELDDLSDDYDAFNSTYAARLPYLFNIDGSVNRSVQARIIPLKASMDQIADLHLHHIMYDTTGRDYGDYRNWLDKAKSYVADVYLANSLAREEDWTGASDQLDDLISKYDLDDDILDEHNRYDYLISLLQGVYDDDRTIYDLGKDELNEIDSLRRISFALAKTTATNILSLYDSIIPLNFLLPGQAIQERSDTKYKEQLSDKYLQSFSITPNPTENELDINWIPIKNTIGEILLYDLNGKVVVKTKIDLSLGQVSFDVSSLPAGMYDIQIRSNKYITPYKYILKL